MRLIFSFVVVLHMIPAFSQKQVSFGLIDQQARLTDAGTLDLLAQNLASPYKTDLEKTRSIFIWITEHIAYNTKSFLKNKKLNDVYAEPDDDLPQLKPLTERTAQAVLGRRSAVCEGYARLFKSLCDHAGIKAEIISGYAKNNMGKPGLKFKTNHTWNAVFVDSSWHLLDVTWASGFVGSGNNDFIKSFDEYYFFTDPHDFIRDHYPEDLQWTLLTDPPVMREFYQSPFKYSGFVKERIAAYAPAKGIIQAAAGDSVKFEVMIDGKPVNLFVTDNPVVDDDGEIILPKIIGRSTYTYKISPDSQGWLYVICNGEIILRYKLSMKNESLSKK